MRGSIYPKLAANPLEEGCRHAAAIRHLYVDVSFPVFNHCRYTASLAYGLMSGGRAARKISGVITSVSFSHYGRRCLLLLFAACEPV